VGRRALGSTALIRPWAAGYSCSESGFYRPATIVVCHVRAHLRMISSAN